MNLLAAYASSSESDSEREDVEMGKRGSGAGGEGEERGGEDVSEAEGKRGGGGGSGLSVAAALAAARASGGVKRKLNSAPAVDARVQVRESSVRGGAHFVGEAVKVLTHNPTAREMWQPVQGPANPNLAGQRQVVAQRDHVDNVVFEQQRKHYMAGRDVHDPSVLAHAAPYAAPAQPEAQPEAPKRRRKKRKKRKGARRGADASDVDGYQGSWAQPLSSLLAGPESEDEEETAARAEEEAEYMAEQARLRKVAEESRGPLETTTFHGGEEEDYQGSTYMHCPREYRRPTPDKCYIPKKQVMTFKGHSKGVNAIRFLPKTGHLLLSASMDSSIKLWGVLPGNRKLLRTFQGHSGPVRDVWFTGDGSRFISASFDTFVKLWDTETGKCISRHTNGKTPLCCRFYPEDENEALVGQRNKRIVQWDFRANETTQEYNAHLGAVNSVTFIDKNRRFVSTSDDKKVFVWEYGIPVVIKHLAEPDMHSMPVVCLHPSGKYAVGQSLDNRCLVYSTKRGFRLDTKKEFKGHLNTGYACQVDVSPDGRFVLSGDGDGRAFFWDWRSTRRMAVLQCHSQVTMGATWHPTFQSTVATCSWDGAIKLWE